MQLFVIAVQPRVVRHEPFLCEQLFHHRVSSIADNHFVAVLYCRFGIVVSGCDVSEVCDNVNHRDDARDSLNLQRPFRRLLPNLTEEFVFQRLNPVFGVQHHRFLLFQFRCNEPFGVTQGLLADVVVRHHVQVRCRHIDVITEDLVVSDFQGSDTAAFPLGCLECVHPRLPLPDNLAEFIKFIAIPIANDAAFAKRYRGFRMDAALNQRHQLCHRIECLVLRD